MQNPEKRRSAAQRRMAAFQFMDVNAALLATRGAIARCWRKANRRCGPYYRLILRDTAGRQISAYLGADQGLAAEVRQRLADLQAHNKERRLVAKARRAARSELRRVMRGLDHEITALGLSMHGTEIRGWRSSSVFKKTAAGQTGGRHDD